MLLLLFTFFESFLPLEKTQWLFLPGYPPSTVGGCIIDTAIIVALMPLVNKKPLRGINQRRGYKTQLPPPKITTFFPAPVPVLLSLPCPGFRGKGLGHQPEPM